ncbi:DUF3035 domain-containing protein [Brevundimonas fluminis]|jgi:hypothetical protein|uniref:DUF3035 domain-containing protein n=1 Tax=Brevundimonas fluminis TaxID=2487274 RepID=UPI000F65680A|nr:DUF3035 domain-containing protein [Brevundimonas fluminis]
MSIRKYAAFGLVAATALSLGACGNVRQSLGMTRVTPDEFLTVSTAPLSLPPEYGLRPPQPGQPRPQDVTPEVEARRILATERGAVVRSEGEQALAARVGAGTEAVDSRVRYMVDDEFGDLAHKETSWADRVMFWRRDDAATQGATQITTSQGAVTIDATTEYERMQQLTGGQNAIVITPRRAGGGFKLPGL